MRGRVPEWALWLVIPAVVFGFAEWGVRRTVDSVPGWYEAAEEAAAQHPLRAVFIGSSRVKAAISAPAFEKAARQAGQRVRGFNLGLGISTLIQHYFGLRQLFTGHPEQFRGIRIFLEVPSGRIPNAWTGPWTDPARPWMLAEVLPLADLPRYWGSEGVLDTKFHVTFRCLTRASRLLRRRERFREHLFAEWAVDLASGFRGETARERGRALRGRHLALPPLSRTRYAPLSIQRTWASMSAARIRATRVFAPWEGSVQDSLADLAEAQGGRLVFFEVPVSSILRSGFETPEHEDGWKAFEAWTRARGLVTLHPDFHYDDADFPDWMHLHPRRAREFSAALARAWADVQ